MILPTPTPDEVATMLRLGFKPDTAYMEVARCEFCRHFDDNGMPTCMELDIDVRVDFGCVLFERR